MSKEEKILTFLIFCLAIVIRVFLIFNKDLWFDEAIAYFIAIESIPNLIQAALADNQLPFFYLILHFFIKLLGDNEFILRLPSLLANLASLVLIYLWGKQLFKDKGSFYLLALASFSPLMVYFSVEARPYSLLTLLTLLSSFLLVKFIKKSSFKIGFGFFLCLSLSLYTHYFAYLLFIPYFLIAWIYAKKALFYLAISFLISLPIISSYLYFPHPAIFSINPLLGLVATFASFLIGGVGSISLRSYLIDSHILTRLLNFITLALGLFLAFRGTKLAFNSNHLRSIILILFLPIFACLLISFFIPLYSARAFSFLAPYFFVLLIFDLNKSKKILILPLLAFLVTINILPFIDPKLSYPQIKHATKAIGDQNTILHTSVLTYYPFKFYSPKQSLLIAQNPLSSKTIEIIGGKISQIPLKKEIYLVNIDYGNNPREVLRVNKIIEKEYRLIGQKRLGSITLYHYNQHQ
ncbi:glycosyltransferase family 39 protein [Candidatus Daviesbacteria bacterium]|nr:glycosyltransferase family 39 protein [Candidatus Daviesbacteria bacterium]